MKLGYPRFDIIWWYARYLAFVIAGFLTGGK